MRELCPEKEKSPNAACVQTQSGVKRLRKRYFCGFDGEFRTLEFIYFLKDKLEFVILSVYKSYILAAGVFHLQSKFHTSRKEFISLKKPLLP